VVRRINTDYILHYLNQSFTYPSVIQLHPPSPPHIHSLPLHDALPISTSPQTASAVRPSLGGVFFVTSLGNVSLFAACQAGLVNRSEEHTSELQSLRHLVCRLLLEKKKTRSYDQSPNVTIYNQSR